MEKKRESYNKPLINKYEIISDFITYSIKCDANIEENRNIMNSLAEWYGASLLDKRLPFRRDIDVNYDKKGYYFATVKNNKPKPITTELKSCMRVVLKQDGIQNLPTEDALFLSDDAVEYQKHPLGITPKRINEVLDMTNRRFRFPNNSIEPTTHRSTNMKAMALTMRRLFEFCYENDSPYMVSLVNHENKQHQSAVQSLGCYPIYPYVYFSSFGLLDEDGNITKPTIWQPWIIDREGIAKFMNSIHKELISNIV